MVCSSEWSRDASDSNENILVASLVPYRLVVQRTISLLPYVALCVGVYPLAAALEGVMIAARDGPYIARTYTAMPLLTAAAIAMARRRLGGVEAAWAGFGAFQCARLVVYGARAARNA